MLYRRFEKGNMDVSLLGLGCMRFPMDGRGNVDEAKAIEMIRTSIDEGVNYIDTAYTYHGGLSERIIAKALKDGYREKTLVADKLPTWLLKTEEDVRRIFFEQKERLDIDVIDMYLVHSVTKESWDLAKKCRVLEILEELRHEGYIKYIGFSFHDEYSLFEEVIDSWDWDFCQIQLNYVDVEFQAGVKGLKYAASKNIPVVIMEPLKGGRITDRIPPAIQEIWKGAKTKRSPAHWAFLWVAQFPEILTILSGMSDMRQLYENLEMFSHKEIENVSGEDLEVIERAGDLYRSLIKHQCTGCKYCLPCPKGVAIPNIIRYLNDWYAFDNNPRLKGEYNTWLDPEEQAANCVSCGQCEKACPQHLPIMEIMHEADGIFGR